MMAIDRLESLAGAGWHTLGIPDVSDHSALIGEQWDVTTYRDDRPDQLTVHKLVRDKSSEVVRRSYVSQAE